MPVTTQIRLGKGWQFNVNQEDIYQATNAAFYRSIVRKIATSLLGFTSIPWTCWKSCDSTAVSTGSSNWTADTSLVWGTTNGSNAHSWIVLAQSGLGGAQILLSLLGTSSPLYIGKLAVSPGGLYTGGTTTTDPTATDEITLISAGNNIIAPSTVTFGRSVCHAMMSTDGQCTRLLMSAFNGIFSNVWIFDKLFDGPTGYTNPVYFFAGVADGHAATNAMFATTAGKMLINGVVVDVVLSTEGLRDAYILTANPTGTGTLGDYPSDVSKKWPVMPCGGVTYTRGGGGKVGAFYDLFLASNLLTAGTVLGTQAKGIVVGSSGLSMPWDGSVNPKMGR